jgi:spore maturation protein CgeB
MLVDDVIPFDFDKRFLEKYSSLYDSELREEIAKNGYERTMKENTYYHRLKYLYDYVQSEIFAK